MRASSIGDACSAAQPLLTCVGAAVGCRSAPRPFMPKPSSTAAPATADLRDFSRSLPMALLRAREAVMTRFRPDLRAHDITEQQWRVLRALTASATPLAPTEISQMTLLSLPSLSRLLKTLEVRGILRRTAHGSDLRTAQLALSPKGRRLVHEIAPLSEASYAEIERVVGADDLQALYDMLDRVTQRLGEGGRLTAGFALAGSVGQTLRKPGSRTPTQGHLLLGCRGPACGFIARTLKPSQRASKHSPRSCSPARRSLRSPSPPSRPPGNSPCHAGCRSGSGHRVRAS